MLHLLSEIQTDLIYILGVLIAIFLTLALFGIIHFSTPNKKNDGRPGE